MKDIGTFECSYGRTGEIWIDKKNCNVCGFEAICLCVDSSEGEYGEGAICKNCIDKAFKNPIEEWDTNSWGPQSIDGFS
jgi:hypothetical protein